VSFLRSYELATLFMFIIETMQAIPVPASGGNNLGRAVALLAGMADSVPGTTVNRTCASSLQAIRVAHRGVRAPGWHRGVPGGRAVAPAQRSGVCGARACVRPGGLRHAGSACPLSAVVVVVMFDHATAGFGFESLERKWVRA
jgi:hypothetical protein